MTQQEEKLSAFLDGELNEEFDRKSVLKELQSDGDAQATWKRYHLVRDCLRNENPSDVGFDISARVADALKSELPMVAPKRSWKELPVVASVIPLVKQSSQLAVAACVTAVMIFGFQSYNQTEEAQPFVAASPLVGPQGGLAPVSLEQKRDVGLDKRAVLLEQRRQINALLEDHDRQLKLKSTGLSDNKAQNDKSNKTDDKSTSSH